MSRLTFVFVIAGTMVAELLLNTLDSEVALTIQRILVLPLVPLGRDSKFGLRIVSRQRHLVGVGDSLHPLRGCRVLRLHLPDSGRTS